MVYIRFLKCLNKTNDKTLPLHQTKTTFRKQVFEVLALSARRNSVVCRCRYEPPLLGGDRGVGYIKAMRKIIPYDPKLVALQTKN